MSIIIGADEYTALKMNAVEANTILLRLNKIILPVIGGLTKGQKAGNILDADSSEVAGIIAENLNEEVMNNIVMPMFKSSRVYSVEKKLFIDKEAAINIVFTVDNLFDLYTLIWEVLKLNFTVFFQKATANFGSLTAAQVDKSLPAKSVTT
jgi:hypothetical protein